MLKKESLQKMIKLLSFRISREEILSFNRSDLILGLILTWVVGIGRYWDDPNAKFLQHLGLGSVIYIFVLSFFIWILLKPFYIKDWSYKNLLIFISLTSLPALLYAIPVERFVDLKTSAAINAYFLLIVAVWRVSLIVFYFKKYANLSFFQTIVATLLPLSVIVTSLTILNLEHAVFEIMGGIRERTSNDTAYMILTFLTMLSMFLILPLMLSYLGIIYKKYKEHTHK